MARGLVVGSTQYLTATGVVSTALSPMTLAAWYRPYTDGRAAGTSSTLVCVQQSGTGQRNQLSALNTAYVCQANAQGATTNGAADGSVGTSANTWAHYAGVYTSATSRTSYINAGNAATNTTNIGTQLAGDIVRVGSRHNGTSLGIYGNGDICEVGVWSVALTVAELASLAAGAACDTVRPQSLVFYAPLIREIIDLRNGKTLTATGSPAVVAHQRVYA